MTAGTVGRIADELPELPGALRRIAEAVLADPAAAARSTIIELAARGGASPATVTRFARTFGFAGYTELRYALAADTGRTEQASWESAAEAVVSPDDSLSTMVQSLLTTDTELLRETGEQLDLDAVAQAAAAMVSARRVLFFGTSVSGAVAGLIAGQFNRIRVPCWSSTDPHEALPNAALLQPGDVVVGVSHRGRTREVLEVLTEGADNGAVSVAVTSSLRTPLAETADHVLLTAGREGGLRARGMATVHSQLFALNALYMAVAQLTYERTTHAIEITSQATASHRTEMRRP
ncbi:MurR/RpiR family transcriptional regulator [Streptomyces sp. NPDC050738]|uniref:MurR/RpiR family transcriptional regulator n=1 Tax=Streptomyces sp. NPDC050738 TaxID=3154744 RepID=UPI003412BFA9